MQLPRLKYIRPKFHGHCCPYCAVRVRAEGPQTGRVVRFGSFSRSSDGARVRRFLCRLCGFTFSQATTHPCYREKKRQVNSAFWRLSISTVSHRRAAILLGIHRKTFDRKLRRLGPQAEAQNQRLLLKGVEQRGFRFNSLQWDEMESFEHTKCKPLSVTLAVSKERRILGFEVAAMSAKGKLAKIAIKKYGPRKDERAEARRKLFERLKPIISETALIQSDENPHYVPDVKKFFPKAEHQRFKGQRGSIVGQGELKKIRFDPLFSLNHTCAMLRANINRLFRKTWCTTKIPERLRLHIAIYTVYHNFHLLDGS